MSRSHSLRAPHWEGSARGRKRRAAARIENCNCMGLIARFLFWATRHQRRTFGS